MKWTHVMALLLALGLMVGCGGNKQDGQSEGETAKTADHGGETMSSASAGMPDLATLDLQDGPKGLQYAVYKSGDGAIVDDGMRVTVHYTGWFKDNGKKFDSSHDHPGGKPFSFAVNQGQVIEGWDLGVSLMAVGSHYLFVLPSDLAYGEMGHPAGIPPNSDLVFDVEVISVQ